jgi:hypothetical protein
MAQGGLISAKLPDHSCPQFHLSLPGVHALMGTWRHLAAKQGTFKGREEQWQTTPKNLPRMQRARAIPVAWLGSGSCQNRPKGWILMMMKKQKMHTFFINSFWHVYQQSVHHQECVWWYQTHRDIDQAACTDAWENTIKPHVQAFLMMNTCMFEICRRQYNWIQSLMKNVCIFWFLLNINS